MPGRQEYYYRDHLGNVRLTFSGLNADGGITVGSIYDPANEIIAERHYYPFGMEMNGEWFATVAPEGHYRYNGKELNEDYGMDLYEYGFRWYDAAIGRFMGVDPIADEFPYLSVYNYASNDPVTNIDLHGLQGEPYFKLNAKGGLTQGTYGAELRALGAREGTVAKIAASNLVKLEGGLTGNEEEGIRFEGQENVIFNDPESAFGISFGEFFGGSFEVTGNEENGSMKTTAEINLVLFKVKREVVEKEGGEVETSTSFVFELGASGGLGVLGGFFNISLEFGETETMNSLQDSSSDESSSNQAELRPKY
ncbi:MAG: RHS repeat domain-containing protein [Phaeodactylibacter xiamenensis]|uniref:RHS repeat-associated core domain-containing protein n=1 Tax=Phaeodactylibacter xiamenensis TaxID=1524460 RepID=A0A098SA40_9BACT|nr:RHS repeat-associated core domain-containing protein [Phaeodactylibacter xiamenensis]KGE87952.1 hypothetical protein IX84_12595 [Phaeodactylibacter xiamenensis]MCR9053847.1 RHS repeat-associated core domain-containing protein [bacterium]